MRPAEEGMLLLCCRLGDEIAPLTMAEYRELGQRVRCSGEAAAESELTVGYLRALGYEDAMCERIVMLLERGERLRRYLTEQPDVTVLTRISNGFPQRLRRLGSACPPAIFLKGDVSLLQEPCVALVGSRRLSEANRAFAQMIGRCAAQEGYVLVSGGAVGADRAAQDACLRAGGRVICIVPDGLTNYPRRADVLYCSDEGYEFVFSSARALRRNGLIHALGEKTFVAQSSLERGGTWAGTQENLRRGLSEVYVFADGSEAAARFQAAGATLLRGEPLRIAELQPTQLSIFNYNL